ncbi:MAG: DMT family transporter [Bacteroidales bacterium]|nr:DMT family transporter [Bacteroidales bacterium]
MKEKKHNWLLYALVTMCTWGVWMTFSDPTLGNIYLGIPEAFPSEMVYVVWALSMIPCALLALHNIKWKLDVRPKSMALSMGVGLLGAGGQLVLFLALKYAPSYLVMPMISVAPIVTVLLSATFLKEKVSKLGILGIVLAFVAIICFAMPSDTGGEGGAQGWLWILLAAVVFICWGTQAFVMKLANNSTPDAESVFVYMAIAAVVLIPVAFLLKAPAELTAYGWAAPTKVFFVQILNAIGAFTLVYANRYGKAMVIAPLADACSPVICCLLSIILLAIAGLDAMPTFWQIGGMVAAISCVLIFSRE